MFADLVCDDITATECETARTEVVPWRRFVLPPDPPVTRVNACLLKIGLQGFQAVVFNQSGAMTRVMGKKRGTSRR